MVVAASGPSLQKSDLEYIRNKARLITINTSYRLAPWADALYACDDAWWRTERPEFRGHRFTQDKKAADVAVYIPSVDKLGLSLVPDCIHQGANSGYQALNLAVLLGAKRIILLGFDMSGGHWHGRHPSPLNNPSESNFGRWRKNFETTLTDLDRAGVSVINASRESALDCFPRQSLESVI